MKVSATFPAYAGPLSMMLRAMKEAAAAERRARLETRRVWCRRGLVSTYYEA